MWSPSYTSGIESLRRLRGWMISRAAVKALIDETEASYRECWATLAKLKNPGDVDGAEGAALFQAMLDFQPTLARALYDLSEMYRELHQERRSVVARKADLTPTWYKRRLALIAEYQRAIKVVISIGRHLGDSFAWIFYADERQSLVEHYGRQGQLHAPPGIGGLGELKFIENFATVAAVNGYLIIYHGMTTFLRLGDVSFFDLKDGRLAALGELKTTKVAENQLEITVSTIGPTEEGGRAWAGGGVQPNRDDTTTSRRLPQSIRAKLDRQVAAMAEPFNRPNTDGAKLESETHILELEAFCQRLNTSSFASEKVGDGLLLVGTRLVKRSLANRLLEGYKFDWVRRSAGIEEEVPRILLEGSAENEVWVGSLYNSKPEYGLTPGMVPMFWWPIDLAVIESILFQDVMLFYFYNPVHLFVKLREAGFEVEAVKGQRGYRVTKKLGDLRLTLDGLGYFTHLIIRQFWDEEAVVEALSRTAEKAERDAVPPNTRIQMNVQQHFGRPPA